MLHFLTLTDADVAARRILLDRYAWTAQLSALVPLLFLQCVFAAQRLDRWIRARELADLEALGSPHSKYKRLAGLPRRKSSGGFTDLRLWSWWAGRKVEFAGEDLGTRGEVLGAVAWFFWLVALCFVQTGEDYFHPTKRFGIVAASQLPLHYLLAMKSPWSPIQLLTGRSHEELNRLHQLLGRIITTLVYLHVTFYINAWIQFGNLFQKLQLGYVICGLVASVSFTVIATTALAPVRHRSYRLFYTVHVTLATALLPLLYFHVSHIRPFLYETFAVYLVSAALRWAHTRTYPATLTLLPGTSLLSIRVSASDASKYWNPAQHAYLALPGLSLTRTLRSNPFTAAAGPGARSGSEADANSLQFVVRILDGNTAKLAQQLGRDNSNAAATPVRLAVEGPYGVSSHSARLRRADRILLVAAGVGATFILPLYRRLLADHAAQPARRRRVTLVWLARSWSEVSWGFEGADVETLAERARVCLTKDEGEPGLGEAGVSGRRGGIYAGDEPDPNAADLEELALSPDSELESIELAERKTLLAGDENNEKVNDEAGSSTKSVVPVFSGRPDMPQLVDRTFGYGSEERVAVVVCGPKSVGKSLRNEVGRWVRRGRDVWFWDEQFGL